MVPAARMKAVIPVWLDRENNVWMDTGETHPNSCQPIIELLNGQVRGPLGLISKKFGPLRDCARP
ncbi:hypothetical protein GCM10009850_011540 [Nonomuraea monospora]|uniref:Transposase n=1 Tax=Nonomuraea monospora TaxID=568818 RepID=A0ABN3C8M4_9ACTN